MRVIFTNSYVCVHKFCSRCVPYCTTLDVLAIIERIVQWASRKKGYRTMFNSYVASTTREVFFL
jgi:hypothetical protein